MMSKKIAISLVTCLLLSHNAFAVFASTSSEISDSTTASTKKIFSQNEKERLQQFVDQNFDRLQEQAARGSGTLLNDYASLMGCKNSKNTVSKTLQENYSQLFNSGKSELLLRTEQMIQTNPSLILACENHS